MDCRNLEFKDETFDLIIDKSTADALLCGSKAFKNVAIMLKECQRVLKTGGLYIAISYGIPGNREFHFQRRHLKFDLITVPIAKDSYGHNSVSLTELIVDICILSFSSTMRTCAGNQSVQVSLPKNSGKKYARRQIKKKLSLVMKRSLPRRTVRKAKSSKIKEGKRILKAALPL